MNFYPTTPFIAPHIKISEMQILYWSDSNEINDKWKYALGDENCIHMLLLNTIAQVEWEYNTIKQRIAGSQG